MIEDQEGATEVIDDIIRKLGMESSATEVSYLLTPTYLNRPRLMGWICDMGSLLEE